MKQHPPGHTGNRDGMKSPHFLRWIWMLSVYVCACVLSHFSRVWLFATPWSIAHQALLSMGILQARIPEWLPCPPPGDLPDLGIEPISFLSLELAGRCFFFLITSATWESHFQNTHLLKIQKSWARNGFSWSKESAVQYILQTEALFKHRALQFFLHKVTKVITYSHQSLFSLGRGIKFCILCLAPGGSTIIPFSKRRAQPQKSLHSKLST